MAWLAGYGYRKKIAIVGTTDGAQTDYQMLLNVHFGSGSDSGNDVYLNSKNNADFDDIRFTRVDGTTELDHWRESYTSSNVAVFWIEFNSIAANPTTTYFYIYYGKVADNTASNGTNTFIIFDDFERGNDGDEVGGSWTEETGIMDIDTGRKWAGTRSMRGVGQAGRSEASIPIANGDNIAIRFRWQQDLSIGASTNPCLHGDGVKAAYWRILGTSIWYEDGGGWQDTGYDVTLDTWHLFEMRNFVWATPTWDLVFDGTVIANDVGMNTIALFNDVGWYSSGGSGDGDGWIDNFLVRNFTATEPTWGAWGSQEKLDGSVSTHMAAEMIQAGLI